MSNSDRPARTFDYVFVGLLVYLSGSALMSQSYGAKLIGMTAVAVGAAFTHRALRVKNGYLGTAVLLLLICCVLFVPLHTGDPDLGPYLTVPLHLLIGYLACYVLAPALFRVVYINLMTGSVLVSVTLFVASQIAPGLISIFPLRMSTESYDYYDAGVHVFLVSRAIGHEGVPFDRNSGFAWEPGAYQVFVNLAILFLLHRCVSSSVEKGDLLKLLALTVGVLSTFSTSGYITLAVVGAAHYPAVLDVLGARRKPIPALAVPIFVGAATVLLLLRDVNSTFMGEKFRREFSNGATVALERIGFDRLSFVATDGHSFFGIGFTAWLDTGLSLWNSIIHSAVTLGVVFTLILLVLYFCYSQQFTRPVAVIALLMIAFSTEALFWRMLFAYLAFSSILYPVDRPVRKQSLAIIASHSKSRKTSTL